jgi:hypothetical protein
MKQGLCDQHAVCVSVNTPTHLNFECLSQSLRHLVCLSWQLRPSQRRTSFVTWKSLGEMYPHVIARQRFC